MYKKKVAYKCISLILSMLMLFSLLSGCGLFSQGAKVTVSISQTSAEVFVGETLSLTAQASDCSTISWVSSDEEVAVVQNGIVSGVNVGTSVIIANCGVAQAKCVVTVKRKPIEQDTPEPKPEKVVVTIDPKTAEIEVGGEITLVASASNGGAITWYTSKASVATVSNGKVKGIAAGKANIIAQVGSVSAVCSVTVKAKPVVTVTISKTSASIEVGSAITLTASSSNGGAITWLSADPTIATVTSSGKVTGVKLGVVVITAKIGTSTATCTVTVKAKQAVDSGNITPPDGYKLVWNDEFNGTTLDRSKWDYQVGTRDIPGNGPEYWGNNELQYYTEGDNISFADGALVITAKREQRGDRPFTSTRIATRDKGYWTFGYMEVRMKTPAQMGMWPAFWMLPQPHESNKYETWAANGEIDIMEARGREPDKVDTTIHYGGKWPQNQYKSHSTVLSSSTEEWHTYAIEWTADYLSWIIDGVEVYRLNNNEWWTSSSTEPSAPFDRPFYILLNLAVGGNYDGGRQPEESFSSANMYVDYVRVFQKQN